MDHGKLLGRRPEVECSIEGSMRRALHDAYVADPDGYAIEI